MVCRNELKRLGALQRLTRKNRRNAKEDGCAWLSEESVDEMKERRGEQREGVEGVEGEGGGLRNLSNSLFNLPKTREKTVMSTSRYRWASHSVRPQLHRIRDGGENSGTNESARDDVREEEVVVLRPGEGAGEGEGEEGAEFEGAELVLRGSL
jgi:hypothetical protein